MVILDNPASWPAFPVLPVVKVGASDPPTMEDIGVVLSTRQMEPVPKVYLVNVFEVMNKPIYWIVENVPCLCYKDMCELGKEWQAD